MNSKQVVFEDADLMQEYVANEIAEFVRDNMPGLLEHPFDYDDHFEYIKQLYFNWLKREL